MACRHVGMGACRHALGVIVAALVVSASSVAAACPWCATEWTQILNNVEIVGINITQAEALRQQFRQLELQIRNARRLRAEDRLAAVGAFGGLVNILETARGASVHAAGVDERYREEFGGYGGAVIDERTSAERYEAWTETSHANIKAALKAAGLHVGAFRDEHSTLRAMQRQTMDADGMLKVMQAAAQIAAMQVEESRKLRGLLAAQVQMQGNVAAVETEREAARGVDRERYREYDAGDSEHRRVGLEELRRR